MRKKLTGRVKNPYSKSFEAGIENLRDEIQLALQWNRPSILIAIHKSKAGQTKSQLTLEKRIHDFNRKVEHIHANDKSIDLIRRIKTTANRENVVFFISALGNANNNSGDEVFRLLNMQREFFIENLIRAVFWLTKAEAEKLPHLAPDFWAFRHRTVEFAPTRD